MQAHMLNLSSEAFCQSKPTARKEERKKYQLTHCTHSHNSPLKEILSGPSWVF